MEKKQKKFQSISKQFANFLLLTIFISVTVPLVFSAFFFATKLKKESIEKDTVLVKNLAYTIGSFFEHAININKILANNAEVKTAILSADDNFENRKKNIN